MLPQCPVDGYCWTTVSIDRTLFILMRHMQLVLTEKQIWRETSIKEDLVVTRMSEHASALFASKTVQILMYQHVVVEAVLTSESRVADQTYIRLYSCNIINGSRSTAFHDYKQLHKLNKLIGHFKHRSARLNRASVTTNHLKNTVIRQKSKTTKRK